MPNSLQKKVTRRRKKRSATEITLRGRSMLIFKHDHPLRVVLKNFIEHPYFEGFIYHIIALNCMLLALSEPVLKDTY
jgi:hypothetical protein